MWDRNRRTGSARGQGLRVAGMLIVTGALLYGGPAFAEEDLRFSLTPFAGYRMGGEVATEDESVSIKLDDSSSFGLLLNWPTKTNTEWEIHYSLQQTEARITDSDTSEETRVDFDAHTAQIGGTYLFEGTETVIPYLAMTLGGTYVKTENDSDTFFSTSLGVGVKFFPSARVGLRLEARGYATFVNSSSQIFCQTGPDLNVCAIQLEGDIVGQVETFAGITVRF